MVQQLQPGKRKRGRPRKDLVEQRAEGDSPLWAIVDQLTLIRDELHHLNKNAEPYLVLAHGHEVAQPGEANG